MDLVIAVLIVVAVQLVLFLYLRGKIHQQLNATSLLKDVQDEVDGMVRELNLSAERNIGLLEARIDEMEGLLAQADQKMILLAREIERRDKASEVYSQLKRPVVDFEAPAIPGPEPSVPPPGPEPEVLFTLTSEPVEPKTVATPPRPRTLKEKVLGYRDQGLEPAAIASATGATQGEVELILSLNPVTPLR